MKKSVKVLFLTNVYRGGYHFRKEIIDALKEKGYEVYLAAPVIEMLDEEVGFHVIDFPFNRKGRNPIKDCKLVCRYIALLRKLKPDLVFSYTIKPNVYGGIACRLCRVTQLANITGLGTAFEHKNWLQRLAIVLYRIGLRKAHTVFFQNSANLQFCEKHHMVGNRKVLLPGSGVNLDYFSLEEYPQGIPIRFLFLSRLTKQKRIAEYLTAAKKVKAICPDAEFHIVGDCEEDVDKLAVNHPEEVFFYHGRQPDVRLYFRQCHCLVHPSYYPEGMSNVLLESCATGRPIITTDRPGCREIIEDGVNGYVVKAQDAEDLKEKMVQFMMLPYDMKREMGLAARRKVEKEFDRRIVVEAYLKVVEEIGNAKGNA